MAFSLEKKSKRCSKIYYRVFYNQEPKKNSPQITEILKKKPTLKCLMYILKLH